MLSGDDAILINIHNLFDTTLIVCVRACVCVCVCMCVCVHACVCVCAGMRINHENAISVAVKLTFHREKQKCLLGKELGNRNYQVKRFKMLLT